MVWTAVGIALGLVINPYFPQNVTFILAHLGDKVALAAECASGRNGIPIRPGTCWRIRRGAVVLAMGLLRPGFGGRPGRRRDMIETTLLLVALLTLFMLFRSRRFIEYYPAFGLLFAAAAWGRHPSTWPAGFPLACGAGQAWTAGRAGWWIASGLFLATTTVLATAQDARSH